MIPSPTPTTLILLTIGVSTLIFIMLLPSILELKKPRDAGPRIIIDYAYDIQTLWKNVMPILDVEEEQGFDKMLVNKIIDIISVLPNLEA
ncbi:MAG: hypothetical protein ACUVQX_02325 [Candidatus Bathycorpusculaceae bacterium]